MCKTEDSEEYDESQDESTTASISSTSKSEKICSTYSVTYWKQLLHNI